MEIYSYSEFLEVEEAAEMAADSLGKINPIH